MTIVVTALVTVLVVGGLMGGLLWYSTEVNGWRKLVRQYKLAGKWDGERRLIWFYGLKHTLNPMSAFSYSALLIVGANEQGLYVGHGPLRWVGYAPICVPWGEIKMEKIHSRIQWLRFTFDRVPTVQLELPAYAVDDILASQPQ